MSQINILSTKKLSTIQKEALVNANFNVIEADFIKTEHQDFDLKNIKDNLIFTSQNAVYSILQHPKCDELKTKNVFCVGLKTKILLSENGFNVDVYTGYASDLAEIITLIHGSDSFTFFSGNLRREILPQTLKEANVNFNEIKVYETTLTPQKIKNSVEAILFFSPSGVESYLKDNTLKKEVCFCIGETTAEALQKTTKNIIIAENPTIEDVIEECINEYK
ncbi:uroporphyrinogen III synthase [Flavobacterium psychrophilum]|uniref:Uroporphyrinogen-III synthase n=1 Tax=Flavobacterium psychrophilum (strain ATCC 49511 / DSM 21280 / CIP 103535 / JIP02/86) TaxID=402612 RepID=A6GVN9_FLAPJ|nr:uroporphyrinogen-III synthase [Flavobacterium psychrophilum]AIN70578.1 uroporphyrinogen III synthase [Flavobacterium psychrophilum FPG101]ROO19097.1 uroporphyrinogen III synthase [Flavobacterium psychrophilum 10]CAL42161.1 Uroporphyrinogen-III synthase [Flavobacterium psychrophilum JIP02/86]AIG28993.1 uroporphyrinogen III synthase [Flavobacterium psychrophilum]AIG31269.1 uroporphyrinogen III synthase [Flavobacterium psychrophilum]